ncbi:MAG TPA: hypothetical protein VIB60_08625 [Methylomirabilota bacterium]
MELTIDPRFNGPPGSGHGGYVSGVVAGLVGGPARVRLHRPPPLGRALMVRRDAEGVTVVDGDAVIATGAAATVEVAVPAPVRFADAELAARGYPGFQDHAFRRCFGCGPDRAPGDGLRIFPGPVAGRDLVGAPWIPDASLTDGRGVIRPEFLWAALDCPSGWAPIVAGGGTAMVLGEMTARLLGPIRAGERCVIAAWTLGREGRKSRSAVALVGDDGSTRAVASTTWIAIARP